jgi:glycerophosphoryl diester phosphodiesterase
MIKKVTTPVIFAHRGASAHAPENTLSSFKLAQKQGAEAIELDVQLTSDDEVIVFHDHALERITGKKGYVKDATLSEIKELNTCHSYGPEYNLEKIPTLVEVFTHFKDFPLINIELKNISTPRDNLSKKVAELINEYQMHDQVLISSFSPLSLTRFHNIIPEIPLGLLIHTPMGFNFHRIFKKAFNLVESVHISFTFLNSYRVIFLKSFGKIVYSYTLNRPDEIHLALKCGVDGFFTDDPAFAIRTVNSSNQIA